MECPYCGHTLDENETFCPNCGQYNLPLGSANRQASTAPNKSDSDAPAKRPKKVAERLYPLPDPELDGEEPPEIDDEPVAQYPTDTEYKQRKTIRRLRVLAVILALLAVAAAAAAGYTMVTTSSLQVQLNKAQRESLTAQGSVQDLEGQVTTLTEDLEAVRTERDALAQQIADLTGQIGALETNMNQSQYDKETAERNLEEIQSQFSTLQEERDDLQTKLDEAEADLETAQANLEEAEEKNTALSQQLESAQTAAQFYDDYVVFVMVGNTDNLYHKYGCEEFSGRNFLAYSTKLAEANGYSPCPLCN